MDWIAEIPKVDEEYAYKMGRDCALHGANETNCHFAIFSKPEYTKAWERGKSSVMGDPPEEDV